MKIVKGSISLKERFSMIYHLKIIKKILGQEENVVLNPKETRRWILY